MKTFKIILFIALFTSCYTKIYSQGMSINNSGALPDTSAMLDVSSSNSGVLIPRISLSDTADASTIPYPSHSLIIFNTSATGGLVEGYYYNEGTDIAPHWVEFVPNPMNKNFNMAGNKITNLATCTNDNDAANKAYVDAAVAGGGGGGSANYPTFMSDESASTMNMMDAARYCNTLSQDGYTDWRIPSLYEVIYVVSVSTTAISNPTSGNYFWCSDLEPANYTSRYITARLLDGYTSYIAGSSSVYVRCVR